MAKVINHGNQYKVEVCNACSCVFGITPADITTYSTIEEYDDKTLHLTKAFTTCPECGIPIVLSSAINEVTPPTEEDEK